MQFRNQGTLLSDNWVFPITMNIARPAGDSFMKSIFFNSKAIHKYTNKWYVSVIRITSCSGRWVLFIWLIDWDCLFLKQQPSTDIEYNKNIYYSNYLMRGWDTRIGKVRQFYTAYFSHKLCVTSLLGWRFTHGRWSCSVAASFS